MEAAMRAHARSFLVPLALVLAGARIQAPITVYIAGDSTAAEKAADKRPETGWGEMLGQYFRASEVRIANRALNGRSTKSFVSEGHWRAITDSLQAGDYVFIQFGHNDESPDKGDRYSPPDTFKANLARMVSDVRAKGGIPVLFTPVYRRKFDATGRIEDTHGQYPDLTRSVATSLGVPLVDMHRASAEIIASYGADSSAKLFLQLEKGENPNYPDGVHDNTHFRPLGAELMARAAVEGIRALLPALGAHLKSAASR
jgi:lysophospholipase L1-like esterase